MGSEDTTNGQSDSVAVKLRSMTETSPVIKFVISLHHDDDGDDDCEHQFEPGDELSGDVVLVLDSPLRVSSMVIELRGEASVAFKADQHRTTTTTTSNSRSAAVSARRPPRRETSSRCYQATELYVDDHQEMLLSTDEDVLQPGEYRFPVSFYLPRGLPTSFRGKFGDVSYVLRASFVDETSTPSRCLATARYVVCQPLLVRRPSPAPTTDAKTVTVRLSRRLFAAVPFLCASGVLRVDFTVADGTVYRLGDDIHVAVQVTNDSPRVVVGVFIALVQLCEFRAQTARRRCVALVSRRCDADSRLAPVGYADTARCTNRLNVPTDLPESRLDGCDVIDVSYELRFAVEVVFS